MLIHIEENNLYLDIEVNENEPAKLLHFGSEPMTEMLNDSLRRFLVEAHLSGGNLNTHHARKHNGSSLGKNLKFRSYSISNEADGRLLTIEQEYEGISVISEYKIYYNVPVMRCKSVVKNCSEQPIVLEYVSSFCQYVLPIQDWQDNADVIIPHNSWTTECNWIRSSVRELGLFSGGDFSLKRIGCENIGSWSTVEYLPMGILQDCSRQKTWFWQIEHNGSWEWEIGDFEKNLYLMLLGPTSEQGAFYKEIKPGEQFISVPAAVGIVDGTEQEAMQALTSYRRMIRRVDSDNIKLPVVYNDFIALGSSPSEEKDIPLIDAAAELNCDIFCIDAGWYDSGDWWDRVGEWQVCRERFPNGLKKVTDYIIDKGMIPGIWLEPEVMGIACPTAADLPDDWFICRYGRRVIDNGRFLFDYRNAEVRQYVNDVLERLIREYHIGYFKLDYNVNAGIGTEIDADSFGDGLLQHNRAVIEWGKDFFRNHPGIIIESCASGGCRMDYAMLSVYSMQSVSDQGDYRKVARISAMCATAITPEQAGIWSAPKPEDSTETVVFHAVNTMLSRIHQSGHIDLVPDESFQQMQSAIQVYKEQIRQHLANALPIWPCGFMTNRDRQFIYGWMNYETKCGFLGVWQLDGCETIDIPLASYGITDVAVAYPINLPTDYLYENGRLQVKLKPFTARLFKITK